MAYAAPQPADASSSDGSGDDQWAGLFAQAGQQYGVDPDLLRAVAKVESGFDPQAKSGAGATGLMQFMPATAKALGIDPSDPAQAIAGAARLLRQNYDRYGSWDGALAAYNGGTDPARWNNPETSAYVPKVLGQYQRYAQAGSGSVSDATAGPANDDDAAWRSKWGVDGSAPAPQATSDGEDDSAWRARWGVVADGATRSASAPMTGQADAQAPSMPLTPVAAPIAPVASADRDEGGVIPSPANTPQGPAPTRSLLGGSQDISNGLYAGSIDTMSLIARAARTLGTASPAFASAMHAIGIDPDQALRVLSTQQPDYASGSGSTILGRAGELAGGAITGAPVYGVVGGGLGAGLAAGSRVAAGVPLLGGLLRGASTAVGGAALGGGVAGRTLGGALSGGATNATVAAASGDDPVAAGAAGAVLGGAGGATGGIANRLFPAAREVPAPAPPVAAASSAQPPAPIASVTQARGGRLQDPDAAPSPPTQPPGTTAGPVPDLDEEPDATGTPGVDAPAPEMSRQQVQAQLAQVPTPPLNIGSSPSAQAAHADTVLRIMAGGTLPVVRQSQIPGVQLSAGAATGNGGIAQVERWARSVNQQAFKEPLDDRNVAARKSYLEGVTGTPDDISRLQDTLSQYDQDTLHGPDGVLTRAGPVDMTPVGDLLDSIQSGKLRGQQDVAAVASSLQGSLADLAPKGALDAETAYSSFRSELDRLQQQQGLSNPAKAVLQQVRTTLDGQLEAAAPGLADWRAQHAAAMGQINSLQWLQNRFAPSIGDGAKPVTTAQLNQALTAINKSAIPGARQIGNGAAAVSDEQYGNLLKLRNDLNLETNANRPSAIGATTFGNVSTNSIVRVLGSQSLAGHAFDAGSAVLSNYLAHLGPIGDVAAYAGTHALRNRLAASAQAGTEGVNAALIARMANPSLIGTGQ